MPPSLSEIYSLSPLTPLPMPGVSGSRSMSMLVLLTMLVLPAAALPSREALFASVAPGGTTGYADRPVQNPRLKDVSGMSYVGGGSFITVHDMKGYEDTSISWPRVSLVQLAFDLAIGIQVATAIPATTRSRPPPSSSPISAPSLSPSAPTQVAEIAYNESDWPTDRKCTSKKHPDKAPYKGPNDLESVAGIPGKPHLVLLCESTNSRNDKCNSTNSLDKDFPADRIYLAEVILGEDSNDDGAPDGVTAVSISDHTSFSSFTYSHNVEGTAVARYGSSEDKYLFLWAERNETTIRWADLELEPNLVIHKEKGSKSFELSTFASWSNRPVVGLDVDSETGDIYLVTSYDAGSEASSATVNADNGPYRSATSIIGNVNTTDGNVVIYNEPHAGKVSHHEGFKVETVARAQNISTKPFMTKCVPILYFACPLSQLLTTHIPPRPRYPATFIGTDDENYGGTIRKIQFGLGENPSVP